MEVIRFLAFIYVLQLIWTVIFMVSDGVGPTSKIFNSKTNIVKAFLPFYWVYVGIKTVVVAYKSLPK